MSLRHEHKGTGGGGLTDIDIISSRNTIEVSRSGNIFDVNVANEDSRNFFVKNFHEFMDAVQTIANLYISGDTVGNVIQLLGNIDMTDPTVDDEANYVLSNGDYLIDLPNKTYNFRQYLRYTKIVSYGAYRVLQLLHPNVGRTAYDTWQLNIIRLTAENIGIGGDIAAWIDEFKHGDVSRSLPCEFQRYLFSSPGNVYYDLRSCNITCAGASQTTPNAFNPLLTMGNTLNASLWVSAMYLTDCRFIAGRSLNTPDPNLNAPIVINSNWFENRRKILQFKQMSKEVNDTVAETGAPNIQIRTDNVAQAQTTWRSHQWEVSTDGTVLVSCSAGDDCLAFAPKLALNDLYLQGTELTPAGNPPTDNYVSLVEILQKSNITFDFGGTNSGQTLLCIADVTSLMTGHFQPVGLAGMLVALPPSSVSGSNVVLQRIIAYGSSNEYPRLMIDNDTNEGIAPFVIQYSSKYYLALRRKRSENYTKVSLLGQTYGLNISPFLLYSNPAGTSWFSDEGHSQTITLSFVRNPEAIRTWFGGTTDKVVAGDGSLLNWNDKLGYWIGETDNLPPVGSRDAGKLYVTTDY